MLAFFKPISIEKGHNIYKGLFPFLFMSNPTARIHRVNYILNLIEALEQNGKIWEEKILISDVCLKFGAGKRYIKEILQDLVNTKKIVILAGEVWTREAWNNQVSKERALEKADLEADEILNNLKGEK